MTTLAAESAQPHGTIDPRTPTAEHAGDAASEAGHAAHDRPADAAGSTSLDRMARLRHLVRNEGMEAEAAAREVGVDPIIAQLWLRLPDDLWPTVRGSAAGGATRPGGGAGSPAGPATVPAAPMSGLRRVLTCRIPVPAFDRLRGGETPILEAAVVALQAGLAQPRPEAASGGARYPRRPLAVPVPATEYTAVLQLAQECFDGDPREAAGWLIARGLGMVLPLPTRDELVETAHSKGVTPAEKPAPATARFVVPPRRRPEPRAPLPPDDSAPSGDELRSRRDALGLSQRDLAAASGLSRGLVAEIERGRRRHVLTRLRLAETLASLERSKPAEVR
ncbi:MAG: helix-turn-helix transcriptional regulator [Chloroflexi bacterium]|nr:helix-turn-helix transcriptional regulator [Chloroflexota bacterium]